MLGLGERCPKKHLAEIKTGQGKSIVLAITALTWFCLGKTVDIACYSTILKDRDSEDFKGLFKLFNTGEKIAYHTIDDMMDPYRKDGLVRGFLLGGSWRRSYDSIVQKRDILLMDEVDVFFSRDYYGSVYRPAIHLENSDFD